MTTPERPSPPPAPDRPPAPRVDWNALDERGKAFGREAEQAAQRLSRDPRVLHFGDFAAFAWGVVLLVIGAWFFADVTLGLDLPVISWNAAWPLILVLIGLTIVARAATRRPR